MKKINLETMVGKFLQLEGGKGFRSLDGKDVAEWLASQGYVVKEYHDTGRNGLATTTCGFKVSTNGYVYR